MDQNQTELKIYFYKDKILRSESCFFLILLIFVSVCYKFLRLIQSIKQKLKNGVRGILKKSTYLTPGIMCKNEDSYMQQ